MFLNESKFTLTTIRIIILIVLCEYTASMPTVPKEGFTLEDPASNASSIEENKITQSAASEEAWGYDHDGPSRWPIACRVGRRQSPIDIDTRHAVRVNVTRLEFANYERAFGNVTVENNGHSIVFSGFDREAPLVPFIAGGGLSRRYILHQFHFHWSHHFSNGSEHTINRHHYPVEVHMVHVREDLTFAEALAAGNPGDTIAVLGVLGMIGEDGVAFEEIAEKFPDFTERGEKTTTANFVPSRLLPTDTLSFYSYDGSLTTPGCVETVKWIIFNEPISITVEQLNALRLVRFEDRADADTRPVQPINGRKVLACFAVDN